MSFEYKELKTVLPPKLLFDLSTNIRNNTYHYVYEIKDLNNFVVFV